MKVVLGSEDVYGPGNGLGDALGAAPALPGARELHRLARSESEAPEAFDVLRGQLDALEAAAADVRARLHGLICEADAVGVRPGVLARWSGYSTRTVYNVARTSCGGEL